MTEIPGTDPSQQSVPTGAMVEVVEGGKPSHGTPVETMEKTPRSESSGSSDNRSDDESDVAVRRQGTRWPQIQANEQAQWRQKAMAKRAIVGGKVEFPDSNQQPAIMGYGNIDKVTGSAGGNEDPVTTSAVVDKSDSTKTSALEIDSVVQIADDDETIPLSDNRDSKELSLRPRNIFRTHGPDRNNLEVSGSFSVCSERPSHGWEQTIADQAGHQHDRVSDEFRPTMSESLNEITERFLKIDLLDGRQDLSRFIAYLLDTVELLSSRVAFLEAREADRTTEDSSSESQPVQSPTEHANVFVGIALHRVFCNKRNHQHDHSYFEDKPTYRDRLSYGDAILMGDKIIHSLDDYIDSQPNVCFLVVNDHMCGIDAKNENLKSSKKGGRDLEPSTERLRVLEPLLQKALLQVADYDPFPSGADWEYIRSEGMRAPYPFLFHHHKRLVKLASNETYGGVLTPLLEFLAANYGKEYEEANSLFEEGLVTGEHISKLFKPQEMVISRGESNALEAHILYDCTVMFRNTISLTGWSWQYDGKELKRKFWSQDIDDVMDERMRIADLKVHPAGSASAEDISNLEQRGRKFWDMRGQAYVCYTGWDEARQYDYVRRTTFFHRRRF